MATTWVNDMEYIFESAPMATPTIQLESITKAYGTLNPVQVLHGIDLEIWPNDFLALLGASGSGKSTLLKVMGLIHEPTSGTVRIGDLDASALDDNERTRVRGEEIGFVFQSFQLIHHLSILENVQLPLYYQRVPGAERFERAKVQLAEVGLDHRMHHRPNELSGGECQRATIARALIANPRILLADEPTGNLDSKTGDQIFDLFCELHARGTTLVMITHDRELASRVPRLLRMVDGRIPATSAAEAGP